MESFFIPKINNNNNNSNNNNRFYSEQRKKFFIFESVKFFSDSENLDSEIMKEIKFEKGEPLDFEYFK